MTSYDTVSSFSLEHDISLTVMEDGEHWFHTKEQMRFLDDWLSGLRTLKKARKKTNSTPENMHKNGIVDMAAPFIEINYSILIQ